jgi:hypothetical protein
MSKTTKPHALAERSEIQSANTAQAERLLTFREVHARVGSNCKSGHYARQLAARGLIEARRINDRTIRYTESSVAALINGKAAA